MSLDSAKKFCQRVQSDEALAKKMAEYPEVEDLCNSDLGKKEGFDFTKDELATAKKELTQEQIDNLHCHTENCSWLGG